MIERTIIDYVVAPSAQNPASFVVSGPTGPFRERLQAAITDDSTTRAESESERQEQEAFAALVKPAWLIGRWVPSQQGSSTCATGPYEQYDRGGRFSDPKGTGSWKLGDQTVSVLLPEASVTFTIIDASMDEFTKRETNGEERSLRRCSASEMQQAPEEPAAANEPEPEPEPTVGPSERQDEAGSKAATSKELEL